jgi:5-methylcytosine-specific restriction protein B
MARPTAVHSLVEILNAADWWKINCLLKDGSIFTDEPLWSLRNIDLLDQYFVQNPLEGKHSFILKLHSQLEPAAPEVKKLAAEMLWILLLFPSRITGNTKRERVLEIWSWSGSVLDKGRPLLAILDHGIGSTGTAYNNKRPWELTFLIQLMQRWKAGGEPWQSMLLSDPWGFGNWVDSLPATGRRQFRHIALYLLFPDSFERISSTGHKEKIVGALPRLLESFSSVEGDSPAMTMDRQLFTIRRGLESEFQGQEIDFYVSPAKELWNPDPEPEIQADDELTPALLPVTPYSIDAALEGIFMEKETFEDILAVLRLKRNAILQGPPGVGKSFVAQSLAYALIQSRDPERFSSSNFTIVLV